MFTMTMDSASGTGIVASHFRDSSISCSRFVYGWFSAASVGGADHAVGARPWRPWNVFDGVHERAAVGAVGRGRGAFRQVADVLEDLREGRDAGVRVARLDFLHGGDCPGQGFLASAW
ncbi:MAG: hypothetical protein IPL89_02540 [Acidobacteria bacterium]|nr:hypothetical protein [Acidobacteriota bacterium]